MPSRDAFAFGPYHLDPQSRRLRRDDALVPLTPRQFDLLNLLVSRAGQVLSKDVLIREAWQDVTVTDNNLVQVIRQLRSVLDAGDADRYIKTETRDGYRFVEAVSHTHARHTDADIAGTLALHRAWIDGRAALETLALGEIARARMTLEPLLVTHGDDASVRIALANACAMQFEATRADAVPDRDALRLASEHAREACRLDMESGEVWATLGFVLQRMGDGADALAALRRAISLEPDNWRHQLRLAAGSWGEERLRAARRTLALLPGYPLAHLLAATVYVARAALAVAERELDGGLAAMSANVSSSSSRFSAVALYYVKGLLCLARGADDEALAAFECELASEARGHLYARECCANTWYAIGACHLRRGDHVAAQSAFEQAIARMPLHPMARVGLALLASRRDVEAVSAEKISMDAAIARAALLVADDDSTAAAQFIAAALASAPPGNAGWLVPVEPLLGVDRAPAVWAPVLAALRARAS